MQFRTLSSISTLLLGMGILLAGTGLIGTLLGLRAGIEGFSDMTMGVVMSAFFLGYIVGAFTCPPLIRAVGHIRAFAAMAALSAVVSLLYGMLVDPIVWWALRVINGICMVGLYIVIESWLNERVDEGRGQVFAVYMMISLLALAGGQYLLLVYGPDDLGSFALVAILFCLGLIPIAMTPTSQPQQIDRPHLPIRKIYDAAPVGVVGALVSGAVTSAFWGLSAIYGRDAGLDAAGVATLVSLVIVGGAALQWPIGRYSDHRDRRIVVMVVALLGAASALGLYALAEFSRLALYASALVYGGFSFSLYGLCVAQTHDRLDRSDVLQATQGLLLLNGIGATVGPLLAGAVMQYAGTRSFPLLLASLLVLLALYVAWRIRIRPAVAEPNMSDFVIVTRTSPLALEMDPRIPSSNASSSEPDNADPAPVEDPQESALKPESKKRPYLFSNEYSEP
ncbi:MAG: MFS transporter [Chromatocurvus sp.]